MTVTAPPRTDLAGALAEALLESAITEAPPFQLVTSERHGVPITFAGVDPLDRSYVVGLRTDIQALKFAGRGDDEIRATLMECVLDSADLADLDERQAETWVAMNARLIDTLLGP